MEPLAARHWRWAWHCPRCGVRNPAATAACAGCDLPHSLIEAPGADVRHTCAVVGPVWATYCIGCGERLVSAPSEHASIAEGLPEGDAADAPDLRPTDEPLAILHLVANQGRDDAPHDDLTGPDAGVLADRRASHGPAASLPDAATSGESLEAAGATGANQVHWLDPHAPMVPVHRTHSLPTVGADEHADAAGFAADASRSPPPGEPPLPRLRPRHILPASDGSPDGLTLTRHALLERSIERRTRGERLRLLGLLLALLLWLGLVVHALAMPGDEVLSLVRAHPIPGRGGDVALTAVERLHRILSGQPAVTPTPRANPS